MIGRAALTAPDLDHVLVANRPPLFGGRDIDRTLSIRRECDTSARQMGIKYAPSATFGEG